MVFTYKKYRLHSVFTSLIILYIMQGSSDKIFGATACSAAAVIFTYYSIWTFIVVSSNSELTIFYNV
jgi:hypothetical protein